MRTGDSSHRRARPSLSRWRDWCCTWSSCQRGSSPAFRTLRMWACRARPVFRACANFAQALVTAITSSPPQKLSRSLAEEEDDNRKEP